MLLIVLLLEVQDLARGHPSGDFSTCFYQRTFWAEPRAGSEQRNQTEGLDRGLGAANGGGFMKVTFDLVFEDTVVIWQMQKEKGHSRRSNSKRRGSAEMRPEKSGGGGQ